MIAHEIERHWHEVEGNPLAVVGQVALSECLLPCYEPFGALERPVNDRPLLHAAATIFPSQNDVHPEIEGPERLAALGRTPGDSKSHARDQSFDQVLRPRAELDVVEGDQRDL